MAVAYRATPGVPASGFYPSVWQRPLTTGTIGRGIASTLVARGYAVRAGVAYMPQLLNTYEHELTAALGSGVDGSGNAYTIHVLRTHETLIHGFLSLGDKGKTVPFWTQIRILETDVWRYSDDTYRIDIGRRNVVVSTVVTDAAPAGARDSNGLLKGAAGYQPRFALPGVMGQKHMLAVCGLHIDRYTYEGAFVDRVAIPVGTVRPNDASSASDAAYGNIPWQHHGIAVDGSSKARTCIYLAHDNLLGLPRSTQNAYLFVATRDEGETWFSTLVNNGAGTGPPINIQMTTWAGMHPLFPT